MTALSTERAGRITGSRVAAVLGVDRYRTREGVLREMVRQYLGAETEFTGNAATEWGTTHEEDARAAYEQLTGQLVLDAQEFITHPEHDWLGVSPDGLVGADGCVEFKAPYRARYRSLAEKPEYAAQIQLQLACTGRAWCDFVIYRVGEPLIVERVDADPDWLPTHLADLIMFHEDFARIVADPDLSAPYLEDAERSDEAWADAAAEFQAADEAVRAAGVRLDQARARLVELADGQSARGRGVSVTVTERAGAVDWKSIAEKYASDVDPAEFRKASSRVVTVRSVQ